jgi:G:T-mismatch repair DNA endonuclease (very short patch repair protein)
MAYTSCRNCSKQILTFPSEPSLYCSMKCRSDFTGIGKVPDSVGQEYLAGKSLEQLGKIYGVSGGTIKKKLILLNVSIRLSWWHLKDNNPTKGKGHTDATKEKLRAATIKQFSTIEARQAAADKQRLAMSEGRISKTSKVEDMVHYALVSMNVQHKRWASIRGDYGRYVATVDFLLENNIVLEVQGDYWHANPSIYLDGPIYASQKRTVNNDIRKKDALDKLGYTVVYVWECDVKKNVQATLKEALPKGIYNESCQV